MPSPLFADRPAPRPHERDTVEALITQTRRLRGDVDAVRRDTAADEDDALWRWQRALCDLAVHQLDDLGAQLDQLKAGRPDGTGVGSGPVADAGGPQAAPPAHGRPRPAAPGAVPPGRVGSAEWNLLTDEVSWSDELYAIFGRPPGSGPLTLDELPSLVHPDDQPLLTQIVTDCLIDGKPIDGEFRVVRADGRIRTVHMRGEPVLDHGGCTASMWAVLRDISELRQGERLVRETRDRLRQEEQLARTEHRIATEVQEAVLPSWRGSAQLPRGGPAVLDLAARQLPAACPTAVGGDWYDALELPGGDTLLTVGELTGQGVATASSMAMLLGALRGMAVAGIEPGALLGHLGQLIDRAERPVLGGVLCSRFHPPTATFSWAQAGHPAPLLFRDGTGCALTPADGVLLGATSGAVYEQAEIRLLPGDLLVLHTDGLTCEGDAAGRDRLLALASHLAGVSTAEEGAAVVAGAFAGAERLDGASVMVARLRG
ncbi:PP2C family protein-serine/threonine phosphatase [Streptomyces sp. NPDC001780]